MRSDAVGEQCDEREHDEHRDRDEDMRPTHPRVEQNAHR